MAATRLPEPPASMSKEDRDYFNQLIKAIQSNLNRLDVKSSGVVYGGKDISHLVTLTAAEYAVITPDATTLYLVTSPTAKLYLGSLEVV